MEFPHPGGGREEDALEASESRDGGGVNKATNLSQNPAYSLTLSVEQQNPNCCILFEHANQ